jgi:hypothetical protein
MNQLNSKQLELHVPVVAWLYILAHAVFLLVGGFVFALLTGIGATAGDQTAFTVLGLVATGIAVLMGALALPGLLVGFGLLARKGWARVLGIVVAILNLLNFPFGTILGLYAAWVLLQDAGGEYFGPHSAATTQGAAPAA